jgi:hypothetical protein
MEFPDSLVVPALNLGWEKGKGSVRRSILKGSNCHEVEERPVI